MKLDQQISEIKTIVFYWNSVLVLYENIDQIDSQLITWTNALQNRCFTCIYNGHVFYTLL